MPALDLILNRLPGKSEDINHVRSMLNNAIVKKVINGHLFEATFLLEPTKCAHCNQHIWIPYGQKCKFCRFSSHSKCLGQISTRCKGPSSCSASSQESESNGHRRHQVKETSALSGLFTYLSNPNSTRPDPLCDHCGTCILTQKYQKCLLCSRIFHKDCEKLVSGGCDLGRRSSQARDVDQKRAQSYEHTSRLTIDKFEIVRPLGKGSFSTVYLAKLRDSKAPAEYAIKVIEKTNSMIISNPEYAFAEWRALNLGRSYPFLAVGHCCFQSRDRLFLVMEYVHGRDLLYYVQNEAPFQETRAQFYAAEIVLALRFLHREHNVVYRDLKLNNIILDRRGHCKLVDFGMAKFLAPDKMKTNTYCGTPYYMSPEVLEGRPYDFSVDWWALGVIIYEMLFARQPFTGDDNDEIFEAIRTSDVRYPADVKLNDRALNMLDGLLKKKPNERLGCQLLMGCSDEILRHPFFLFKSTTSNQPDVESHLWQELVTLQVPPPAISASEPRNAREQTGSFAPVDSNHLLEVRQNDFDDFSSYSESFAEELDQLAEKRTD